MSLSEELKKIRVDSVMSQEEFAAELGVTQITITRWENGRSVPSIATMKRILAYCKKNEIDVDELSVSWKEKYE